jgi:hypothetical protein
MFFSVVFSFAGKAFEISQSEDVVSAIGFWSLVKEVDGLEFFLLPLVLAFSYFMSWIIVGQDNSSEIVIPVFSTPKNIGTSGRIDPGSARYAMQRELDNYCFEANLFDLAVKGYISIEEESPISGTDKISFITRTDKEISNDLPVAEVSLLKRLFCKEEKVLLFEDSLLSSQAFTRSETDMKEYGDKIFTLNREYWILCSAFFILFPFLGHISNMAMRFVLSIAVLIYIYYSKLDRIIKKYSFLLSLGIRRLLRPIIVCSPVRMLIRNSPRFILRIFFLPLGAIIIFLGAFAIHAVYLHYVFLINIIVSGLFCCLFVFFLHRLLPNYTKEGKKLIAAAEGLKLYMTTTDRSKVAFLNPPTDSIVEFERLLPWAFAFGITESWINRFKDCLEKEDYNPTWFSGDQNKDKLIYGNKSGDLSRKQPTFTLITRSIKNS